MRYNQGKVKFITLFLMLCLIGPLFWCENASAYDSSEYRVVLCFGKEELDNSGGLVESLCEFKRGSSDIGWYCYYRDHHGEAKYNTHNYPASETKYDLSDGRAYEELMFSSKDYIYHYLTLDDFEFVLELSGQEVMVDSVVENKITLYFSEEQLQSAKTYTLRIRRKKTGTVYSESITVPALSEFEEHAGKYRLFQLAGQDTLSEWRQQESISLTSAPLSIIYNQIKGLAGTNFGANLSYEQRQLLHFAFVLLQWAVVFINVIIIMVSYVKWTNPNRPAFLQYFIKEEIKGRFFVVFLAFAAVFVVSFILDIMLTIGGGMT